jgi:pilus assembly protein CpaB
MKIIAILVLVFGVALAGGAIYFASTYFEQFEARMASQNQGPKTVNVIVAKTPLPYGTVIVPNQHLRWQPWPEDSLPEGVFTEAEALIGDDSMEPEERRRVVLRQIEPGEPILKSKVSGFGASQRMAMQLSEGKRAFTIRIDAVSGVAGFISPGDRVDIMMTRNTQGGLESVVILKGIQVIAVDHETNQQANRPKVARTATVEVTPTQAQKLALAQQLGRLSLTLRALEDEQQAMDDETPETVDVRDLLGIEDAPAPEPERPAGTRVILRRGGAVADQLRFEGEEVGQ